MHQPTARSTRYAARRITCPECRIVTTRTVEIATPTLACSRCGAECDITLSQHEIERLVAHLTRTTRFIVSDPTAAPDTDATPTPDTTEAAR